MIVTVIIVGGKMNIVCVVVACRFPDKHRRMYAWLVFVICSNKEISDVDVAWMFAARRFPIIGELNARLIILIKDVAFSNGIVIVVLDSRLVILIKDVTFSNGIVVIMVVTVTLLSS